MGLRSLLLLIAIVGVIWIIARLRKDRQSAPKRRARVGKMVRCAHCGLHLPSDEALSDAQGHHYCCAEHRKLGPGETSDD
jgi:uncharacterized protein